MKFDDSSSISMLIIRSHPHSHFIEDQTTIMAPETEQQTGLSDTPLFIYLFFYEMFMHYYMNARIYKVVNYTNINAYPVLGECNSYLIEHKYITR